MSEASVVVRATLDGGAVTDNAAANAPHPLPLAWEIPL